MGSCLGCPRTVALWLSMEVASENGLVLVHWRQKLCGVKKQLHGAHPGQGGTVLASGPPAELASIAGVPQLSARHTGCWWRGQSCGGCCWHSAMGSKSGRRQERWPQGTACPEPRTFLCLVLSQRGGVLKSGRENGWDSCPERAKGILCAIEHHAQYGGVTQNKRLRGIWGLVWHCLVDDKQL